MKKPLILFLRLWRLFVSPFYPPSCRYYPSCSEYAIMAVEKYGAFKGMYKAIKRVLRCHPLAKGGVDYP
ncbi:membrane protein insertion efficiency factor YidD [Thermocrinis minervae]|uniref:Putative membrane protein insertion efficiency factor n=1 Tax=Thermocrinis minervae TaxID=381751 RepID=A0A1M6RC04_9AQUI|nr:membrane protein insertion efficiency factor YidD [Thermocrinis minervae]SHK29993.1 hypothetical protein SAMN05444391_0586 [Thermocrinis minervae]